MELVRVIVFRIQLQIITLKPELLQEFRILTTRQLKGSVQTVTSSETASVTFFDKFFLMNSFTSGLSREGFSVQDEDREAFLLLLP